MRYETVIFDLDGTLLDTLDDIRDSLNRTLSLFGLPEQGREAVRDHVGNGSARLVELSVPGGMEHPQFREILDSYMAWYAAHCLVRTAPYPGLPELAARLRREGVRTAIVSNKPDDAVKSLADALFPGLFLAAVGEKPGVRRKPAPDTVLSAMEELGARTETSVYVGDSEVDIITAHNAGLPCISVCWGFRDREELERSGADEIVSTADALWSSLK